MTLAMEMRLARSGRGCISPDGSGDAAELVRAATFFFERRRSSRCFAGCVVTTTAPTKLRSSHRSDRRPEATIGKNCGERRAAVLVMRDGFMAENVRRPGGARSLWRTMVISRTFEAKDGWKPMATTCATSSARAITPSRSSSAKAGKSLRRRRLPVLRTRAIEHLAGRMVAEYSLPPAPPEALSHTVCPGEGRDVLRRPVDRARPPRGFPRGQPQAAGLRGRGASRRPPIRGVCRDEPSVRCARIRQADARLHVPALSEDGRGRRACTRQVGSS